MAAQTGRTHYKHVSVWLDNVSGTLTDITSAIDSVGQVGLEFDKLEMTAWSDGVKNVVIGHPQAPLQLGGPWDTTIHAMMITLNGRMTPLSLDIRAGIRQAWEAGEPQFGISSSATSGYVVHSYMVDFGSMKWSAQLDIMGSVAPAFGTAAET